ncbi:MAG: hypothetical protein WC317_06130 [Candidatus Omnitrophota bacterium]
MKSFQIAVVLFAVAAAYILFTLGIRPHKLNKIERRSLFLSSLLLMLGFLSFGGSSYARQDELSASSQQKKISQPLNSTAVLCSTLEWKDFKAFWKKLDQIKPRRTGQEGKDERWKRGYRNSISQEQYVSLHKELRINISNLKKVKGEMISAQEIDLLDKICSYRIDNFCMGSFTMSRMIIPGSAVQDNMLDDLEIKVDKLIELKGKGKINDSEFQQALANVQRDVEGVYAFDIIRKKYGYYHFQLPLKPSDDAGDLMDEFISAVEKSHSEYELRKKEEKVTKEQEIYYKDIDRKYLETKKALEEFKTAFPRLNELIADLENE